MKNSFIYLWFIVLFGLLYSCQEVYTPKPDGYFRDNFPEKKYTSFDTIFPYSFEYPVYSHITKDKNSLNEPYWINLNFDKFKAQIHISYKEIRNNLTDFEEDAKSLAYKHTIKAEAIKELVIENKEKKVYGIIYDIEGNVASSVQFYLTDSTNHFLRAALYFNVVPNKDSLSLSLDFIRQDIDRLINTFQWKIVCK